MSTDPYPEVSVDELGIVPPQGARPSEWPKKLRTLTAAELDRLTIDNSGRFYWDGKLVNYDTGTKQLTDKTSEFARPLDGYPRSREPRARRPQVADDDRGRNSPSRPAPVTSRARSISTWSARKARRRWRMRRAAAGDSQPTDQTRLTLSRWQTVGAVIVVLAIVIGAIGMATYGYVAARDWGCKTGTFQSGCPAANVPPPRADIPA